MIILGCDPGISGAIAKVTEFDIALAFDMPVRERKGGGKIRNEVDPKALQSLLRKLVPADEKAIVVMESLNAFMGSGERQGSMSSQASLAATKAVICTVCELTGLAVEYVSPRTWQGFFGIANQPGGETTKKQSLRIARGLFGRGICPLEKHDGRADALLIARWAQRTMT